MLVASLANIFSHPIGCLFVYSFLCCAKAFEFYEVPCVYFVTLSITLGDGLKKILPPFMSGSVLPVFSSKRFIVDGLLFRSLIHLVYTFVYGIKEYSKFIFFM